MANLGTSLGFKSDKEHIPEIERFNLTIKERVQSERSATPFKKKSILMIFHSVATAIFWLNDFTPSKPGTGLSNTKGPGKLFLGTVI